MTCRILGNLYGGEPSANRLQKYVRVRPRLLGIGFGCLEHDLLEDFSLTHEF